MPLVAEHGSPLAPVPWDLDLEGQPVVVGAQITVAGVPVAEDELTRRLEMAYRKRIDWAQLPRLGLTLFVLGVIGIAMILAMSIVAVFFVGFFGDT